MKKTIICMLVICTIVSLCACGTKNKDSAVNSAVAPASSTEVNAETSQEPSESVNVVAPDYGLYQEEIDLIISEMDNNITDIAANKMNRGYCHGNLVDADGTEAKQFVVLYTPDANNLYVELMRFDKEGNLLTVRDDLGLMAGSLSATVRTGLYGEVPAFFVVTTNYDAKTRFGEVYVYTLDNYDIKFVHEESYTGDSEYKLIEQGILAPAGSNLCEFKDNGAGQKIDEIHLG